MRTRGQRTILLLEMVAEDFAEWAQTDSKFLRVALAMEEQLGVARELYRRPGLPRGVFMTRSGKYGVTVRGVYLKCYDTVEEAGRVAEAAYEGKRVVNGPVVADDVRKQMWEVARVRLEEEKRRRKGEEAK